MGGGMRQVIRFRGQLMTGRTISHFLWFVACFCSIQTFPSLFYLLQSKLGCTESLSVCLNNERACVGPSAVASLCCPCQNLPERKKCRVDILKTLCCYYRLARVIKQDWCIRPQWKPTCGRHIHRPFCFLINFFFFCSISVFQEFPCSVFHVAMATSYVGGCAAHITPRSHSSPEEWRTQMHPSLGFRSSKETSAKLRRSV